MLQGPKAYCSAHAHPRDVVFGAARLSVICRFSVPTGRFRTSTGGELMMFWSGRGAGHHGAFQPEHADDYADDEC